MTNIYQRGNQNPYIEEEQTTQWTKEKWQKDKQRSTKHTYKSKDPSNTNNSYLMLVIPETSRVYYISYLLFHYIKHLSVSLGTFYI